MEEALYLAAGRSLRAKSGGEHSGVVAEQRVARAQEPRQVGKGVVRECACCAVNDQEA
jgi:hypothetical protein